MKITWWLLALVGGMLVACAHPVVFAQSLSTPIRLSASGALIEEHALVGPPELEPLVFVPVKGTQAEILGQHAAQRRKRATEAPPSAAPTLWLGEDKLAASRVSNGLGQIAAVQVYRNGDPIYTFPLHNAGFISNPIGFFSYADHWVLEVADAPAAAAPTMGEVIHDGAALTKQYGYAEVFGAQLIRNQLFYFFRKEITYGLSHYGLSLDGLAVDLGYTRIHHYGCCSAATLNPVSGEDMVAFFAQRGETWYYVEVGMF